jgi:outer membrane protein OmpA-like peptidoglycan-associated protein
MKRFYQTATLIALITIQASAQDFLGVNTGNYAGITGVMLQPASIVDSRYKFDVNLFTAGVNYANNYLLVDRNALLKFSSNNYTDYKTFKSKYLSEAGLASNEKAWATVSTRIQMPLSFMATINKNSAIALNMQSRTIVQGRGIPGDLAKMAYNGFEYDPTANPVLDASGFNVHALNWAEIGLTYGHVLFSNSKHFLKAAFTGKYLGGIASAYVGSNNINFGINPDSSLNFNTTRADYNHSQTADFNNNLGNIFKNPDASAFGFDAGIVYEFRGNIDRLDKISKDDQVAYLSDRRDANKYMFKLGVSLLDAGRFSFTKPDNVNSFSANVSNWRVRDENFNSVKEFDTALASRVSAFPNDPRNYKVHLPTALSVQLDMRFVKGLYLNVMAYRPLKLNNDEGYRFNHYGYYTITPRWEGRRFGVYIPYTFSDDIGDYKRNMLGASFRVGPLFVGSSNLGSMAFNKQLRSADIYIGLKLGITYGKSTKASRLLEKINFNRPAAVVVSVDSSNIAKSNVDTLSRAADVAKSANGQSQLLVDYKNGLVYSIPNQTGNVVIINNNTYYYGSLKEKTDTAITKSYTVKSTYDSSKLIKQDAKSDTLQQRMQDSLNRKKAQLDSLIKNLEKLRKSMDSSGAYKANITNDTSARKSVDSSNLNSLVNREIAKLNLAQTDIDTLVNKQMVTQTKETSSAVLTTDEALKKKTNAASVDTGIALKSNPAEIAAPTPPPTATAVQPAPYNTANQLQNEAYQRELKRQRDNDYNNYVNLANSLRSDINDLQRRINRQQNRRNTVPIYIPGKETTILQQARPDTLVKRDTVVIRDTVYLTDNFHATVAPIAKDTIVRTVITPTDTVFVEKDKIVKAEINYSELPVTIVLFALNKTAIEKVYFERLNYVAELLTKDPEAQVNISGHTDKTGTAKANEIVSLKRAEAVKNYLLQKGVSVNQMHIHTFSDTHPIVEGNSKLASSQNRRVEIKISSGSD